MLTDEIGNRRTVTTSGQSNHRPFLERAPAKLEETHGARIHHGNDDRLVALTKCHERVDLDGRYFRRGRRRVKQEVRQQSSEEG